MMSIASKEVQVAGGEWEGAHLLLARTLVPVIAHCRSIPNMVIKIHVAGGRLANAILVPVVIKRGRQASLGRVRSPHLVECKVNMGVCRNFR